MNANAFIFTLPSLSNDTQGFYKKGLIDVITSDKFKKLTIAGIDLPKVIRGIQEAGPGSIITVGTAKNHDIEWIERPDYAREKGYNPVYDLVSDWTKIMNKLEVYYNAKYPNNYSFTGTYGKSIQVFDGFVKIGDDIYPWKDKTATLSARDIDTIVAQLYRLKR